MIKPKDVPDWDAYFLSLALEVAKRSKDPATNHGAIVVDEKHRVLGVGYNGGASGIPDDAFDWSRPEKYAWVIHAEENALWHSRKLDLSGCTLYVTGPPCSRCMLRVIHRGIRKVIHGRTQSHCVDKADIDLSLHMAKLAGTEVVEH